MRSQCMLTALWGIGAAQAIDSHQDIRRQAANEPVPYIDGKHPGDKVQVVDVNMVGSLISARSPDSDVFDMELAPLDPVNPAPNSSLIADVIVKFKENLGGQHFVYIWGKSEDGYIFFLREDGQAVFPTAEGTELKPIPSDTIPPLNVKSGTKGLCRALPRLSEGRIYVANQALTFSSHKISETEIRVNYPDPGNPDDANYLIKYSWIAVSQTGGTLTADTDLREKASLAYPFELRLTSHKPNNNGPVEPALGVLNGCMDRMCKEAKPQKDFECVRDEQGQAVRVMVKDRDRDFYRKMCWRGSKKISLPIAFGQVANAEPRTLVIDVGKRK